MRGKVVQSSLVLSSCGITPAYAGKSEYFNVKQIITKDHPRLCGEKGVFQTSHDRAVGSPPPMRGKAYRQKIRHRVSRITPAYAGKSCCRHVPAGNVGDHPRLCGEKFQKNRRSPCYKGSPPPMRGKGLLNWRKRKMKRITPAYAGKSRAVYSPSDSWLGSPPPMRGKGPCKRNQRRNRRITPAYAGKSRSIHVSWHC